MQVSFHKRATNSRALLRKMTHKDKASYESSPPCKAHRSLLPRFNELFSRHEAKSRMGWLRVVGSLKL